MEQETLYEVDSIVDRKRERGKTFYKVHWAGYGSDDDTWEPESNLKNCKAHIKKFLKQQGPIVEKMTLSSGDESMATTPKLPVRKRRVRPPYYKSSTNTKQSVRKFHHTSLELTPTHYYLRSTLIPRSPLKSCYPSSEDETKSNNINTPTLILNESVLSRRGLHVVDKKQEHLPVNLESSPSWMQLGLVEMIFCLLLLATVLLMFWLLQNTLNTT